MTKRKNFTLRLQPLEKTPLYEVTEWLQSLPTHERNRKIANALVMCYLFYARHDGGQYNLEQLSLTALSSSSEGNKHFHTITQILNGGATATKAKSTNVSPPSTSGDNFFELEPTVGASDIQAANTEIIENPDIIGHAALTELDGMFDC